MATRELFTRVGDSPILTPQDWPYPANAVFNAAAAIVDGETMLMARVEDLQGVSHLTIARSKDGLSNWRVDSSPTLRPHIEHPQEEWGVEDPRITWLSDKEMWAVAYTAYSHEGPMVALALTRDFKNYERLGTVLPPENKDAALFPQTFNGEYVLIHRPVPSMESQRHMWIARSPDLIHWGQHQVLLHARSGPYWDANKIGLSAQPLRTDQGWLVLYHGVKTTCFGAIYRQGLALLDLEDPTKVIGRTKEFVFAPYHQAERTGDVGNVVFSCGWTLVQGEVRMYYGVSDTSIAVATAPLSELLAAVQQ